MSATTLSISPGLHINTLGSGLRGRPKFEINEEQLLYLLHLGFSVPRIASLCGVSIRRRMSEFSLSVHAYLLAFV